MEANEKSLLQGAESFQKLPEFTDIPDTLDFDSAPIDESDGFTDTTYSLNEESYGDVNKVEKIWRSYLYGQIANVAKASAWWSMFGILVVALIGNDNAIRTTRIAFNAALIIISPLAGAVSERVSIRKLLAITTSGRLIIWTILVPCGWLFIKNYWHSNDLFYAVLVFLIFVDGIQVAFANVEDIDSGGLDTLSNQYRLPINDFLRNKFNSIHQNIFDLCFIFFTTPFALLIWVISIHVRLPDIPIWGTNHGTVALLFGVSGVFLLFSVVSIMCYLMGLPPVDASNNEFEMHEEEFQNNQAKKPTLWQLTSMRLVDIKEGFFLVIQEKALGWRFLFLAFETALEDSMVSVIIPEIALHSWPSLAPPNNFVVANVWAAGIIATGKFGGYLAGMYINTYWVPPSSFSRDSPYRPLFSCILLSSLSVFLFPLSRFLFNKNLVASWVAASLIFAAVFLFFVFSTAPKIGFATLLQSLVASQHVAEKVFGFVGAFITFIDGLVITIVSLVFTSVGPTNFLLALVIIGIIYTIHGLLEAFVGPFLILEPPTGSSARSQVAQLNFPLADGVITSAELTSDSYIETEKPLA